MWGGMGAELKRSGSGGGPRLLRADGDGADGRVDDVDAGAQVRVALRAVALRDDLDGVGAVLEGEGQLRAP